MILRKWKFTNRPTWRQPLCFPRVSAIWDVSCGHRPSPCPPAWPSLRPSARPAQLGLRPSACPPAQPSLRPSARPAQLGLRPSACPLAQPSLRPSACLFLVRFFLNFQFIFHLNSFKLAPILGSILGSISGPIPVLFFLLYIHFLLDELIVLSLVSEIILKVFYFLAYLFEPTIIFYLLLFYQNLIVPLHQIVKRLHVAIAL